MHIGQAYPAWPLFYKTNEVKKMSLKEGEKYLSISLLGSIKLAAFKNKNKKEAKDPDFTGNGIAIWVNEKKAAPTTESVI